MRRVLRSLIITFALAKGYAQTDSALFQAVRNGDTSTLRAQLAHGADKNAADRRGATLLMHAAAFGSLDAVQTLLDAGADIEAANSFGATALVWAASDEAKVHLLVEHGAKVNVRTKLGRTPLMIAAACSGCSALVRYLLAKGADVQARDEQGADALESAALAGDAKSVELLLAAGADAKALNKAGVNALMRALQNCEAAAAQSLLAHGASVNAKVTDAGTVKFGPIQLLDMGPLSTAAPYCNQDLAHMLTSAGADANSSDIRGLTPLMLSVATEVATPAKVRSLIAAGAEVNAKDRNGETALDWAMKYGNPEVIAALQAAGARQGVPYTAPNRRPSTNRSIRAAVEPAVSLLARSSTQFFTQSGCVGCHHQAFSLAAFAATKAEPQAAQAFQQMIVSEWTGEQEQLLERQDPGGSPDGEAYAAWALSLAGYAPNAITDVVSVHIAMQQLQAGNWHVGDISRAPIQESDIARTARCLRLLQRYGPPGRKPEFSQRIARAAGWLEGTKVETNDDAAMQMVGVHWAGARIDAHAKALLAQQHADGGWSQNRYLASDAFATGETLWALHEAGALQSSDPAYRHGVEFLLRTQFPDGSWYVRSRAPKIQPYFQSGFPFAHDQWISSAATAWDVLALAPSMEKEKSEKR